MATKTQIAVQNLAVTNFKKARLFLTIDPTFDIGANSPFVLEGKIRNVTLGINETMGTCLLEFPGRPFGSHTGLVIPIAIFLENTNNMVFRGFVLDEEGELTTTNDTVSVTAYDYKWLLSRITKVRGKIYTVDNDVVPDAIVGGFSRVFSDDNLYEKFRMAVPDDPNEFGFSSGNKKGGTGFISGIRTTFNEFNDPDCATKRPEARAVFKFDPDINYYRAVNPRRQHNERHFWNYATILFYIYWHYIGNVYRGVSNTTRIDINYTSLYNIIRFGNAYGLDNIIPLNFDLTDLSPLEAIDKVVKSIPGMWYWRLIYFPKSVMIDIQCNSDISLKPFPKSLFIGTGGKVNEKENNNVNIETIKVGISAKNAVSHAVAIGGPIEIETSVQYLPAWPQYLRPTTDRTATYDNVEPDVTDLDVWDGSSINAGYYVSDFKGWTDYNLWKQFMKGDLKGESSTSRTLREQISRSDEKRYAAIYRAYIFPENASQILKRRSIYLDNFLPGYENYISTIDQLLFKNVLRIRNVKNPLTDYKEVLNYAPFQKTYDYKSLRRQFKKKPGSNPPFVFLYDGQISEVASNEAGGISTEQSAALLKSKRWILPQSDKNCGYSLEQDNKVILFQNPQYERVTVSALRIEDTATPIFGSTYSRRVFVTCRIECDVPLIKDRILNRSSLSNARLVMQSFLAKDLKGEVTACIRTNAYYPSPFGNVGTDVSLEYGSDEDQVDDIEGTQNPSGADLGFGCKLINWNSLDGIRDDANIIVDDSHILDEIISNALERKPLYDITLDVGLGTINASFLVGDRIDRIVGSELADGSGGYYNLDCIIDRLTYEAVSPEKDSFKTKMTGRNCLPITGNFMVRKKE